MLLFRVQEGGGAPHQHRRKERAKALEVTFDGNWVANWSWQNNNKKDILYTSFPLIQDTAFYSLSGPAWSAECSGSLSLIEWHNNGKWSILFCKKFKWPALKFCVIFSDYLLTEPGLTHVRGCVCCGSVEKQRSSPRPHPGPGEQTQRKISKIKWQKQLSVTRVIPTQWSFRMLWLLQIPFNILILFINRPFCSLWRWRLDS